MKTKLYKIKIQDRFLGKKKLTIEVRALKPEDIKIEKLFRITEIKKIKDNKKGN